MSERTVTIGADPEIPVYLPDPKKLSGGGWIPACGLFGGEKGDPIMQGPEGGWVEDGVMLELNPSPSSDPNVVMTNINTLLDKAQTHMQAKNPKFRLKPTVSTCYFDQNMLDKHPKASIFGCSEDYSAYLRGEPRKNIMERAMKIYGKNIRFAGGHVHIGISDWPEELPKWIVVRFLDLLASYPVIRAYGLPNNERAEFYGTPGIYRETKYGVEYRTPCNYWLVEKQQPFFLARVKAVANLFARFEDTKDELVAVYNKINWDDFYASLSARDHSEVNRSLGKILNKSGPISTIELAGRKFIANDHRSYIRNGRVTNDLNPTTLEIKEQAGILQENVPFDNLMREARQAIQANVREVQMGRAVAHIALDMFAEPAVDEELMEDMFEPEPLDDNEDRDVL